MAPLKSWLSIAPRSHFSIANIPFGIISTAGDPSRRPAVAIGDYALDLRAFWQAGGFKKVAPPIQKDVQARVFGATTLNGFAALGRKTHGQVRRYLQDVLRADTPFPELLQNNHSARESALIPLSVVQTHLPLDIGDYTDFFAGRNHAFNVGTLFRGPENALNPNYYHLPVGYHGRASSVVVSGTPIRRPRGQVLLEPKAEGKKPKPTFVPSRRLDLELEIGLFLCKENELGTSVSVSEAEEYIFGYVLMNDWSARDLQVWEYVPLGPFNAKNFGTTISPWVVLADALEPFRAPGLANPNKELQEYLRQDRKDFAFDIKVEVVVQTENSKEPTTITRTSTTHMVWSWEQIVAHHTVAGCNMRVGDLLGSGTISGTEPGTYGSVLEHTQGGRVSIQLNGGEKRKFFEDGDTVTLRGVAGDVDGELVGFGECSGKILPAPQ